MARSGNIETLPPQFKGRAVRYPEQVSPESEAEGQRYIFDAVLFPNRSLPKAGFIAVMSIVIGANIVFGVFFMASGAWPVLAFCGLDIFAVWLAFRLSYRQGLLREQVRVTRDEMWVCRVLPSGHETRWQLQPFWTRVAIDLPVGHESQLRVTSKGGILILGSFLSPPERARFAEALSRALNQARS